MKQQKGDNSRAPKIYKQETDIEQGQIGYVLRRNLNNQEMLRTWGTWGWLSDFNDWATNNIQLNIEASRTELHTKSVLRINLKFNRILEIRD